MEHASSATAPEPDAGPEPGRARRRKLNPNERTKNIGKTEKSELIEQKTTDAATEAAVFELSTQHAPSDIEAQVLSKDRPEGLMPVPVEKHTKDDTGVEKTSEELMVKGAEPLERRHNTQEAKSDAKATARVHEGIPSAEDTTPSTDNVGQTVVQPSVWNCQEAESHTNTKVQAARDVETPRNSSSASGGGQDAPAPSPWSIYPPFHGGDYRHHFLYRDDIVPEPLPDPLPDGMEIPRSPRMRSVFRMMLPPSQPPGGPADPEATKLDDERLALFQVLFNS